MNPCSIYFHTNSTFLKYAVRNPTGTGFSCMFCSKNYPAIDQPSIVAHVYHLAKIAPSRADNCPLVPIDIHDHMLRVWVPPMKASERFYQYPVNSKNPLGSRIPIHKKKKAGVSTLQRPSRNRYSLRSNIQTEDLNNENMEINQSPANVDADEKALWNASLLIENRLAESESMLMVTSDKLRSFVLDRLLVPDPSSPLSHNHKFWQYLVLNPTSTGFSCKFCSKMYPVMDRPSLFAHVHHLARTVPSDDENCPLVPIDAHDFMRQVFEPLINAFEDKHLYLTPSSSNYPLKKTDMEDLNDNYKKMEINQLSENADGPDEEAPWIGDDDYRLQIENRLAKLESMLMATSDKLNAFLDTVSTPTPPSDNA